MSRTKIQPRCNGDTVIHDYRASWSVSRTRSKPKTEEQEKEREREHAQRSERARPSNVTVPPNGPQPTHIHTVNVDSQPPFSVVLAVFGCKLWWCTHCVYTNVAKSRAMATHAALTRYFEAALPSLSWLSVSSSGAIPPQLPIMRHA